VLQIDKEWRIKQHGPGAANGADFPVERLRASAPPRSADLARRTRQTAHRSARKDHHSPRHGLRTPAAPHHPTIRAGPLARWSNLNAAGSTLTVLSLSIPDRHPKNTRSQRAAPARRVRHERLLFWLGLLGTRRPRRVVRSAPRDPWLSHFQNKRPCLRHRTPRRNRRGYLIFRANAKGSSLPCSPPAVTSARDFFRVFRVFRGPRCPR
jgi:hypothetical protein